MPRRNLGRWLAMRPEPPPSNTKKQKENHDYAPRRRGAISAGGRSRTESHFLKYTENQSNKRRRCTQMPRRNFGRWPATCLEPPPHIRENMQTTKNM